MRTEKEQHDAEIEDMQLVHIGFLIQELGLWKGHSFDFGNYPTALQSDRFTQMVYESDMNPRVDIVDSLDLQTIPLLNEIEPLVRSPHGGGGVQFGNHVYGFSFLVNLFIQYILCNKSPILRFLYLGSTLDNIDMEMNGNENMSEHRSNLFLLR